MPRYAVTCTKTVTDYLRCVVEVEADSIDDAQAKAIAQASEQDLYEFWQCGDCLTAQADALLIIDEATP